MVALVSLFPKSAIYNTEVCNKDLVDLAIFGESKAEGIRGLLEAAAPLSIRWLCRQMSFRLPWASLHLVLPLPLLKGRSVVTAVIIS